MNNPYPAPVSVLMAFHRLIQHYISRQQIVVDAMIHLRTDIIRGMGIDKILGINVDQEYEYFLNNHLGNPDILNGTWKAEWVYRLHGHGCRLTHMQTGEPLEWDVAHPQAFFPVWFATHLEWRLKYEQQHPDIQTCSQWAEQTGQFIFMLMDYLIELQVVYQLNGQDGWFIKT